MRRSDPGAFALAWITLLAVLTVGVMPGIALAVLLGLFQFLRSMMRPSDQLLGVDASLAKLGRFDKMLIDPPREGAVELVKALGSDAPRRIVYVSCNPATLARDAAVLVALKGYRFVSAGVVNMFPHTAHVESIALFERT
jgi:MFS superfamily sulfate permease-like transporter